MAPPRLSLGGFFSQFLAQHRRTDLNDWVRQVRFPSRPH